MEYNRTELYVYGTIERIRIEVQAMRVKNYESKARGDRLVLPCSTEDFEEKANEITEALNMLGIYNSEEEN